MKQQHQLNRVELVTTDLLLAAASLNKFSRSVFFLPPWGITETGLSRVDTPRCIETDHCQDLVIHWIALDRALQNRRQVRVIKANLQLLDTCHFESLRSLGDHAVCVALGAEAVRELISDQSTSAFPESPARFHGNGSMLGFDHSVVLDTASPSVLELPEGWPATKVPVLSRSIYRLKCSVRLATQQLTNRSIDPVFGGRNTRVDGGKVLSATHVALAHYSNLRARFKYR